MATLFARLQEFHAHRVGNFYFVGGLFQGAVISDLEDRNIARPLSRNKQPTAIRIDPDIPWNFYLGWNSLDTPDLPTLKNLENRDGISTLSLDVTVGSIKKFSTGVYSDLGAAHSLRITVRGEATDFLGSLAQKSTLRVPFIDSDGQVQFSEDVGMSSILAELHVARSGSGAGPCSACPLEGGGFRMQSVNDHLIDSEVRRVGEFVAGSGVDRVSVGSLLAPWIYAGALVLMG